MNTHRRWSLIALLAASLVCLILWIGGPSEAVRLGDGTTLRLLGVSTGTNSFTTEHRWHRLARRVLPVRYQHFIPDSVSGECGFKNSVTFWFDLIDQDGRSVQPRFHRAEIVSDNGEIFDTDPGPNCGMPYSVIVECFPRHQRSFRFRIYNFDDKLLGEIHLPNPSRGPFPEWNPDSLPVTQTNGALTTTLTGIRKVRDEARSGNSFKFNADLEFRWQGVVTTDWEPGPGLLEDATGNRIYRFGPGLPRAEKTCRWRVWMQQRPDAPVPAQERFVVTNLPVPGAGTWSLLNITTNVQKFGFWFGAWVGPSAISFSNNHLFQIGLSATTNDLKSVAWGRASGAFIQTNVFQQPTLIASVRGRDYESAPRIVFRDQDGQVLPVHRVGPKPYMGVVKTSPGSFFEIQFYRPELSPNVRTVSLEVTVQPRREMTFFITPPE